MDAEMNGPVEARVVYEFGPFRVDPAESRLLRDGVPVAVTPKTFETLVALVSRAGRLVEKAELLREVWPDAVVEESSLSQHVYLVRKALGDERGDARCIETIPKRGYRFVSPVRVRPVGAEVGEPSEPVATQPVPVAAVAPCPTELGTRPSPDPGTSMSGRLRATLGRVPRRRVPAALLVAGLAGLALLTAAPPRRGHDRPQFDSARWPRAIAVLPFQLLSGNASDDRLGLGLADATIGELGRLERVPVLPTSSVFKYVDAAPDPRVAARELAVDAVLTGTVQRVGERVRVSVQLTDSERGLIWSRAFDHDFRNLFDVQDSVSAQVAAAVALEVGGGQASQTPRARVPRRPDAYDAYVRGLYFWNQRTAEGLQKAGRYFEEAATRDPGYAPAHAGLADATALLATLRYGPLSPEQAYEKARTAARRALQLDDKLAAAHTALALILARGDGDRRAAEKEYRIALHLDPGSATALQRYARLLVEDQRLGPAVEVTERALALDPLSPALNSNLCYLLYLQRDYGRATGYCDKAIELQPELVQARTTQALIEAQQGHLDVALAQLAAARRGAQGTALVELLEVQGYAYARAGRRDEARAMLTELRGLTRGHDPERLRMLGIHAALGDTEDAFALLRSCARKWPTQPFEVAFDPRYDSLRHDPRYGEVMSVPPSGAEPSEGVTSGAGDRRTLSTLY